MIKCPCCDEHVEDEDFCLEDNMCWNCIDYCEEQNTLNDLEKEYNYEGRI